MASAGDRRAALTLLALALLGAGVRIAVRGPTPPGAVAFRPQTTEARPDRDSVAMRAQRLMRPVGRGERIDVDRADALELTRLPRIGNGLATRIVQNRDREGPFGSLEALGRVSGVGPFLLETIRPHVTFSGTRTDNNTHGTTRVSLNRASEAELSTLPGIGPVRARAIVEDRSRYGSYETLADLTRVRGIGPATVKRLEGLVTVP